MRRVPLLPQNLLAATAAASAAPCAAAAAITAAATSEATRATTVATAAAASRMQVINSWRPQACELRGGLRGGRGVRGHSVALLVGMRPLRLPR